MQAVDLIIYPRWLIPIKPQAKALTQHALVIHKDKIIALANANEINRQYKARENLHLDNHILLPGLINAHTHNPMSLFRGLADDLPLMDWLNKHIWPAEAKWLSSDFVRVGMELAIAEMVRSGTTCFNEFFFFTDTIAEVTEKLGMRAKISSGIFTGRNAWGNSEEDFFNKAVEVHQRYSSELITIGIGPHSPYAVSEEYLLKIRDFAIKNNVPITMHVQETLAEIEICFAKYQQRPLEFLNKIGILQTHFESIHSIHLIDKDIEILQRNNCHVIHCPESNLKLASGLCPVNDLHQAGINVALGTDGPASNNDLDMFSEMRTTALIGKLESLEPTALSATQVLNMATINGAKALGLEKKIGSLEPGKQADIIAIDLNAFNTQPVYDPISQIVYAANSRQVTDVWVAGRRLLANGSLTMIDEKRLLTEVNDWRERIGK